VATSARVVAQLVAPWAAGLEPAVAPEVYAVLVEAAEVATAAATAAVAKKGAVVAREAAAVLVEATAVVKVARTKAVRRGSAPWVRRQRESRRV